MATQLKCSVTNFTNILHVADIHIRLTKRHDEYVDVFNRLYDAVDKTPKTTVVCVLGDVFHNKSDLSPECVEIGSNFLKNLADRRPTVLIAGNHDATLANKNRMDCLSPIVNALQHDNLFYLKDTGIYILGDILFNTFSVFDEHSPEKYVKFADIPKMYVRNANHVVALYHGGVNDAVTDVGFRITNRAIANSLFDGHHIALLGDIHKYQVLQPYDNSTSLPAIVYSGSLIQQNHGETLKGHGFVYWNLANKAYKHIEVPNDYGFYTIDINNGVLETDTKDIPKKTRLRYRCFETLASDTKSIIDEIKKQTEVIDVSFMRVDSPVSAKNAIVNSSDFKINSITDVDYQNELIANYIKDKHPTVTEDVLKSVSKINQTLNSSIEKDSSVKSIRWKPKKLEFDNMFSYGEGNVVDFSKMTGVMGLFAPNASGKSTVLSALSFCIFDKCERTFKAAEVMNSQKQSFRCKFNFEINKIDYFIERKGSADKKGNVKVDVKFWKEENGQVIELNGEARRNTNDLIRDYLGTYDDFILTVLSIQNGKTGSFINLGQTERKDLLAQFMGLTVFDKLHELANEKTKETSVLLKNLLKTDHASELTSLTQNISNAESVIAVTTKNVDKLTSDKNDTNDSLIEETKKLMKLSNTSIDIASMERNRITFEENITTCISQNQTDSTTIEDLNRQSVPLVEKVKTFKDQDIESNVNKHTKLKSELLLIERDIDKKKMVVNNKLEKLKKLEDHKYDPNCEYCVNNVFVKDAINTKADLQNDKVEVAELFNKQRELKKQIADLEPNIALYQEYKTLVSDIDKLNGNISTVSIRVAKRETQIEKETNALEALKTQIKDYYDSKDAIETNKVVQTTIDKIKQTVRNLEFEITQCNKTIADMSGRVNTWTFQKSKVEDTLKEIKTLEKVNASYSMYTEAVSRDGLQYNIISKAIPEIEREVNTILSQIVEFTISLQTDGKNVSTFIVYEDKKWKLELASGLEQFVSSLAIRVALINISNLPRPNFIAIDEGFGCADADNLAVMSVLFSFLKSNFDFIWIISHLDAMKDMVDSRVEIHKDGGFSRINYE